MSSSRGNVNKKASAKGLQRVTPVDHPNKSSLDSKKVPAVCKDLQRLQVSQEKPSSSHFNPSASQQTDSDQTGIIKDKGETPYLSDSKRISTDDKPSEEERQPGDFIHPKPRDPPKKTSDQSSGLNKNNSDQDPATKLRGSSFEKGNRQRSQDLFGSENIKRVAKLKETNREDLLRGAPKKVVQKNPIPSQTEGKSTLEAARGGPQKNPALHSSTTDGDQKTNICEELRGPKNRITNDSEGVEKNSVRPNLKSEKQNSASGKKR